MKATALSGHAPKATIAQVFGLKRSLVPVIQYLSSEVDNDSFCDD